MWSWRVGIALLAGCGRLDFAPASPDAPDAPDAAPLVDAGCPAGFSILDGGCYLVVGGDPAPATWLELEARCEAFGPGTHLAVIDDVRELDTLLAAMTDRSIEDAVIGFSDLVTQGVYLTVLGTPAFLPWGPGEPGSGRCGGIEAVVGTSGVEMVACDATDDYVCEADGRAVDPAAF